MKLGPMKEVLREANLGSVQENFPMDSSVSDATESKLPLLYVARQEPKLLTKHRRFLLWGTAYVGLQLGGRTVTGAPQGGSFHVSLTALGNWPLTSSTPQPHPEGGKRVMALDEMSFSLNAKAPERLRAGGHPSASVFLFSVWSFLNLPRLPAQLSRDAHHLLVIFLRGRSHWPLTPLSISGMLAAAPPQPPPTHIFWQIIILSAQIGRLLRLT